MVSVAFPEVSIPLSKDKTIDQAKITVSIKNVSIPLSKDKTRYFWGYTVYPDNVSIPLSKDKTVLNEPVRHSLNKFQFH